MINVFFQRVFGEDEYCDCMVEELLCWCVWLLNTLPLGSATCAMRPAVSWCLSHVTTRGRHVQRIVTSSTPPPPTPTQILFWSLKRNLFGKSFSPLCLIYLDSTLISLTILISHKNSDKLVSIAEIFSCGVWTQRKLKEARWGCRGLQTQLPRIHYRICCA